MIVKKYTDENDNPQALAKTRQRTWIGTETALDAASGALAGGVIGCLGGAL